MEQMEKNQEERSLLAEQREQEKEQLLEYMEQLHEEDLRVTGAARPHRISPAAASKPSKILGFQGVDCFYVRRMLVSQRHHHPLFIVMLNIYLAVVSCWAMSNDLGRCPCLPGTRV